MIEINSKNGKNAYTKANNYYLKKIWKNNGNLSKLLQAKTINEKSH